MVRCYDCGQPIAGRFLKRMTVETGHSWGRGYRTYHRKVNLCPNCCSKRERQNNRSFWIGVVVLVALVLLICF
jgi:hypothetical protein